MNISKRTFLAALPPVVFGLASCGKSSDSPAAPATSAGASKAAEKKKRFAFVTNGVDPFWNTASAGVRAAEKDFGIECQVLMPPKGLVDQQRMIESVLARGVDGIAISPCDAANQVGFLNDVAGRVPVITHDSDAPLSKRLCFVGMDNYKAGRAAGKLVKEILPSGGKVMLFVGRMEQLNSQQRRQGIIDEILDRPMQTLEKLDQDPLGRELPGGNFVVLDTRTDGFDYPKAKANAEDAMSRYQDLAGMIGLWAYNAPMCLEAAKAAGKVGKVKIVSFDEQEATLQGIIDGHIHGTVSQQPYYYGYDSVRILKEIAAGNRGVIPANGFFEIPIVEVRKANVEEFWQQLKKLQAAGA